MILRDIEIDGQPTGLRDATSVAWFAGPIANTAEPPQGVAERFQRSLLDFYREMGIVSAFSRINPVAGRLRLLDGLGMTIERGMTLVIDLTAPLEVQLARYKSERRKKLRRLAETELEFEVVGIEHLDEFMSVYTDTMERNGADSSYRFDREYVRFLLTEMADVMHLYVCKLDGQIISAVLNSCVCGMIEGYIGGTSTEFRQMSPSTFLYDRIRLWGTSVGVKALHMGGGVNGEKDTIYSYKLSFGADEVPYHTWRCVADEQAYDRLCRESCGCPGELDQEFFPKYRDASLRKPEAVGV